MKLLRFSFKNEAFWMVTLTVVPIVMGLLIYVFVLILRN
jgi:hypothetical protein